MDIKQLQYLVVSIDNGSFKKASELLYTTQPHISKTIKSLEVELGMQLLKRNARGVEATEEGRKVYEYACRILVDSGKIQHVREEKDIRMLKIAVTPDDELNHLFRTFYAQEVKEGLHVEYMERNAEELLRMVHHHRVDIGFLLVDQNQKTALLQMLTHKRLEFTEIGKRSPVLLGRAGEPVIWGRVGEQQRTAGDQTDSDGCRPGYVFDSTGAWEGRLSVSQSSWKDIDD